VSQPLDSAAPLDGDTIKELLAEVADRLTSGSGPHVVVIVGGSLLAWHGLRDTTMDVDSVDNLEKEVQAAVAEIAAERGLEPDWLNANAARFRPATLLIDDCEVLLPTETLVVLGAPLRVVFAMKLLRGQPNDLADIVRILPEAGFDSATEAVESFYRAYPHEPGDPELPALVVDLAARAGIDLSLTNGNT
jgi:hypothetical protein